MNQSVIEEDHQVWRFLAGQGSSHERRTVTRVLSTEGAQALTSIPLSCQEGWQSLELLDAHTLEPDGRQIKLTPESIQKQNGLLGGNTAASWPEYRVCQLKFPDVQVGDRVVLHYRLTQIRTFLPDWSAYQWFANQNFATRALSIEVQAPAAMPLAIESSGVEHSRSDADGVQVHRFTGEIEVVPYDSDSRNASTTVARVVISTLPGNQPVADRFARGMDAKMVLGPTLRELALHQTEGLSDTAAKAQALYDWVRKNIRYNAVYLGAGGWVPHDIEHILDRRYGDCKDHVLLLMALLKAVDVKAVPAMINTGNDYALNNVASPFNHVIVYIPTLDRYIDPTDIRVPFEELPFYDRGKPVLLARAENSSVGRTPVLTPDGNRVETTGEFTLGTNGTFAGVLHVDAIGHAASLLQQRLIQVPAGDETQSVRRWLEQAKHTGSGTLRHPPVDRDRTEQKLDVDIEITDYLASTDAGSLSLYPNVPAFGSYIVNNIGNFTAQRRRFAMPCTPVHVHESFTIHFDPGYSVERVPPAMHVEELGMRFDASYRFENHILYATRDYVNANTSMLCEGEQYARLRPAMQAISQHLREQLLYQR